MKNSAISWAILAGGTILLAACDNGGGGGGSGPVPLATKSDGLRELGLSIGRYGALSQYIDFPSGSSARASSQQRPGQQLAKALEPADCGTIKGVASDEEGSRDRDFKLLSPAVSGVRVQFQRQNTDGYRQQDCYGEGDEIVELFRSEGAMEYGSSDELETGQYAYFSAGSGDKAAFTLNETYDEGQLGLRQLLEYLGTAESFESGEGTVYALRLRLKTERFQEGGIDYKASVGLGDREAPLRATVTGDSFELDGSYSYSSNNVGCEGGKVRVSTPSAGGIAVSDSRPVGGELRLQSGGSTASFSFNADGSATLVINGGTGISVTAEEVEDALSAESSPCAEEATGGF
jgi:hypothetical protein